MLCVRSGPGWVSAPAIYRFCLPAWVRVPWASAACHQVWNTALGFSGWVPATAGAWVLWATAGRWVGGFPQVLPAAASVSLPGGLGGWVGGVPASYGRCHGYLFWVPPDSAFLWVPPVEIFSLLPLPAGSYTTGFCLEVLDQINRLLGGWVGISPACYLDYCLGAWVIDLAYIIPRFLLYNVSASYGFLNLRFSR